MPPLPPLPPDSTPRGYITYTSGGLEHTLSFRCPAGATTAQIQAKANAIIPNLQACMDPTDSVLAGAYSNAGSNVRFNLTVITGAGNAASSPSNDKSRASFISMGTKCQDGRLVNLFAYFLNAQYYTDARIAYGALAPEVQALFDAIDAGVPFGVFGIGGFPGTLRPYVNTKESTYWNERGR